ncbi:Uncharacterised protein [Acinetobacter baumannii]|nr:Uncharacterised protein [Acinetobacter baumannii]
MLYPGQAGVPVFLVRLRVKTHRQRPQIGIERRHIKLRANRLQAGAKQHVGELDTFVIEEGDTGTVQFVAIAQVLFHLRHVLAHAARFSIFTNGIFGKPVKIVFQRVLRLHHNRHAHHRPLREQIHQRIDFLLAAFHFTGDCARLRRTAQFLDRNGAMRLVIEPPYAVIRIGYGRGEQQGFGKIILHRHRAFRRVTAVKIGGIAVQRLFIHPLRAGVKMT